MNKHIGIIGAGFTGLAAAFKLHDHRVIGFEACERVAGRIRSISLSNGETAEQCCEWINAKDEQILGMIGRLGLSKAGVGRIFYKESDRFSVDGNCCEIIHHHQGMTDLESSKSG
jgi:protoporphyrinogen oxidase